MSDESSIENMDEVGVQNDGEPVAVEEVPEVHPEVVETEQPEETPEQVEERKGKSGAQRNKEKVERLRAENEALRNLLLEKKPETSAKPEPINSKPKFEDFDWDLEAYTEAIVDWKDKTRREAEEAERAKTNWEQKLEAGRAKFEDFDEVINSASATSPLLAQKLVKPSTTPEMLYYLATHPDEYNAINRMRDSDDVADALAEIKVKLKAPIAKPTATTSKAPPPIKPVTPRGAVVVNDRLTGIESF